MPSNGWVATSPIVDMTETERWAIGLAVMGFLTLSGWFIAHGRECKQWREKVMEKIGRLEGKE